MKKIISILTVATMILTSHSANAARQSENAVKGVVLEKTGEPLGWATAALMSADSTIIDGAVCDENGRFALKAAAGSYILRVSMIGFVDYSSNIEVVAGENEVPAVYMEPEAQVLAGATVTERVKLVEMKMDKVVVNVSQSAFAQGSTALELIKKAPGVTIDKDGNIKLNGKSVAVWIDGRPSYVDGKSLESLLRSTNGESIDKFEIMEHPSSKYDAAGQGGIINIKTKKNLLSGFNGSMGLGGGGMYFNDIKRFPWQESFWMNLAYRTKNTNTFVSVYEGIYVTPMTLLNHLSTGEGPSRFSQEASSLLVNNYHNYNVKVGNDWFINDKNTLGVIVFVPGDYVTFNSDGSRTRQWMGAVPATEMGSYIRNKSKSTQVNTNLNFTHIFDESRSAEITANVDYYLNVGEEHNTQKDSTTLLVKPYPVTYTDKIIDGARQYNIYSAKLDYQTLLWKMVMFETGAKWAMSNTVNNTTELESLMPDVITDYTYREHIAAGYFTMAGQFGPKFSAKIGLRGEYTNSFGDWKSSGNVTRRGYFDVFPTAYVGYTPTENWRLTASYSRRISRPSYSQLNPTKTYVDSRTYIVGNPDILPQYSDDVNFMVGYGQHLSLNLGYNHENNMVTQLPSFDTDGTEYLTWGNYGVQHLAYANFNVSALPVAKWLEWTMSLTGFYVNTSNSSTSYKKDCFGGNAYTDFTFLLPKSWKIDVDGFITSPMIWSMYKVKGNGSANLAVKKSLLDNKLTFTLKCVDLFRTSRMDLVVIDESALGASADINQKYYSQKITFDITWSFGQAKQSRYRKVGNLEEISRAGSQGLGKN